MANGSQLAIGKRVLVTNGKYAGSYGVVKRCTSKMVVLQLAGKKEDVRIWQSNVVSDLSSIIDERDDEWMKVPLKTIPRSKFLDRTQRIETILEEVEQLRERVEELTNLVRDLEL
jgi:hypothetical protein